jgi:hypothetical protein
MVCRPFNRDGMTGFVCGPRLRIRKCACGSGLPADLLCDWKVGEGKTCDLQICRGCSISPAEDKDLCPGHAKAWKAWKAEKARLTPPPP